METFAPEAKFTTIRVLLVIVAVFGGELDQVDVKMAYPYGAETTMKKVYME